MLHYWFVVFARAISDSLAAIGHTKVTIAFALIVISLTAFWSWKKEQEEQLGWRVFLKRHLPRELLRVVPIAIVAWVPFFIWFVWETPYKFQIEALANENAALVLANTSKNNLATCEEKILAEVSKSGILSDRVAAQQQTINAQQSSMSAQQGTVNAQQSTLNAQQGTVSTCVVKLTELNSPRPLKTGFSESRDEPTPATGQHVILFVITTDREVTPAKMMIDCEAGEMERIEAIPADGTMFNGFAQVMPPDKHKAIVVMSSPVWSPDVPILVRAYYTKGDNLGACALSIFTAK